MGNFGLNMRSTSPNSGHTAKLRLPKFGKAKLRMSAERYLKSPLKRGD